MGRLIGKVAKLNQSQGHIGLLQRILSDHYSLIHYSSYVFFDNGKFISRQPAKLDVKGQGVVRVLPLSAWILAFSALLAVQ